MSAASLRLSASPGVESTKLGSCFGTRAELVSWAMAQGAATRWILDEETSDFVPLD
jgi:hypothetical protein